MNARITIPFVLALAVAPRTGARASEGPEEVVRHLLDVIKRIDAGEQADAEALSLIDVQDLSEFGLAKQWQKLSPKQQKEFVDLLSNVLAVRAFPKAGSFFKDLDVSFDGVSPGKNGTTVATSVISPEEGKVVVEYGLHRRGGEWLIYDVILDGVSLRTNIRAQFQKIISAESYGELLRKMRKKLDQESE